MSEELIGSDESSEPSGIEGIHRVVRDHPLDREFIKFHVDAAIEAALDGQDGEVISRLQEIVPTYKPYVSTGSPAGRIYRPGDADGDLSPVDRVDSPVGRDVRSPQPPALIAVEGPGSGDPLFTSAHTATS